MSCLVNLQAFQELVQEANGNTQSVVQNINNVDLKAIGKGCLPDDVNRTPSAVIKGPHVLQVAAIIDISKPSYKDGSSGGDRLLMVKLTDGKISCKCVEYQKVDVLHENLPPGTKVVLTGANVRTGVVQLTPKCIKVSAGCL